MCLIVDPEKTKNFKRNNRRKEITVYKVVFSLGEGIYTPYRNTRVVPGQDLVAKEKCCPDIICGGTSINGGAIHVFLDKQKAIYIARSYTHRFIIKCTAKAADFIAKGDNGDACFTKISIPSSVEKHLVPHSKLDLLCESG